MDMKHCLLRRLLGLVPLLLGISFLSFVLIQLSPGDPAEVAIRVNDITPTPELLAEMRAQLGLDRPFPERYLRWLADVLRGDLGTSYVNGRPVAGELARALPPTLMLAGHAAWPWPWSVSAMRAGRRTVCCGACSSWAPPYRPSGRACC